MNLNEILLFLFSIICFVLFTGLELSNIFLKKLANKFQMNKQNGHAVVTGYFQHHTNDNSQYSKLSGLLVKVEELGDKEYACNCQVHRKDYPVGANIDVVYTKTSDKTFGTMVYLSNKTYGPELKIAKIFHLSGIICLILSIVLLFAGVLNMAL